MMAIRQRKPHARQLETRVITKMSGELFDPPFNLAGESQSSDLTAEAEARVRALAESEARKAQLLIDYDLGIDGVPYGD